MSAPLLEVRGLCVGFEGAANIIDGFDLAIRAGESIGLVGSSGAGKSLLARALLGLLPSGARSRAGLVIYDGQTLSTPAQFARLRGAHIAYVFQDAASSLHPLKRVATQLHECLRVHAPELDRAQRGRRIGEALEEVGLADARRWLNAFAHQLSGGQRQRVMLALTLLPQPKLLIADEPTSALDPVLARRVCDLLAAATQRRGMALLLISHDLPRVAEYCERIYRLQQGRVVAAPLQCCAPTPAPALTPAPAPALAPALIEARGLSLSYASNWRWPWQKPLARVIDGLDLRLTAGQRLAVIGSSGSGKSSLARGLLRLLPALGGEVRWFGQDLARLTTTQLRLVRPRVQLVFQDPFGSLDPLQRVDAMLAEALRYVPFAGAQLRQSVHGLLAAVGLPADAATRYPSQFSGGQRQRLAIARALATQPAVLICDEATSALDADTQTQILNLLDRLAAERGLALLFISHDLAAVARLCDRLLVLDGGRIVEQGETAQLLNAPQSAALRALLDARPQRRSSEIA